MTDGVKLIADERVRQITVKGWSDSHDDAHTNGELIVAAIHYATANCICKPPSGRIGNLAKAGALIAAEIDRIMRAGGV
jgi:hypothetical protein